MPYVLLFNRPALGSKMARLARFLDLATPSFDSMLQWVLDLRAKLAIPRSLVEIGVDDRRTDEIARKASADGNATTNPVRVGAEELRGIFEGALESRLRA